MKGGDTITHKIIANKKDKDKNAQSGIYKPVSILAKCVSFCRLKIANIVHFAVPNVIIQVGSWICMIVFSIRVIGEFKNAQSGIYKPVSILAKCVSFCRLKIPK
jgi:hypothetical protein